MVHDRIRAQSRIVHSTWATHGPYEDFLFVWMEAIAFRARRFAPRHQVPALSATECGAPQRASWNLALPIPCGIGSALQTRYFAKPLVLRKFPVRSSAGADFLRRQENAPRLPCLLAESLAAPKRCRHEWHWAATKSSRSPPLAFRSTAALHIPLV